MACDNIGSVTEALGEDPELERVSKWLLSQPDLVNKVGLGVRTALDEIIDTPRTGRWDLEQCGDQEKAYLGVKVEHVLRGTFQLDWGMRGMDYLIDGVDVDCKWTKTYKRWQIPREAVGHLCLLVWADDPHCQLALGLIRIQDEILVGGNQDKKRTIQSPGGLKRIRWIIPASRTLHPNFLLQLASDDRDAILGHPGGDARARELFRRCDGVIIDRHTIESIGQQADEGRRFRGETRASLLEEGFEVLNGHWKAQRDRARELGGPVPHGSREWVCLRTDGTSLERRFRRELLRQEAGLF